MWSDVVISQTLCRRCSNRGEGILS